MSPSYDFDDARWAEQLRRSIPAPSADATATSRASVDAWFESVAPKIAWQRWSTPNGPLFLAAGDQGLIRISYRDTADAFLEELDRRARLVEDPDALAPYRRQLSEYFDGQLNRFSLPLDLTRLTAFQKRVLTTIARIPAGAVWSYRQVAEAIGKPKAARFDI